jgi:type II secretory pathway pseudopilin PulG
MPPLDDQIEDMDPSNMSDLDETAAVKENLTTAEHAASSPATGEDDNDLLSVVRDVVKDRKVVDTASPAEGEEVEGLTGEQLKKPDDENYSDVPFNKHPRFQQLLRKAKTYEQDAGRYHNVERFLFDAGISSEEAFDGLTIMGLAKTNPAQAWQQIRPWLEKLVVAAGEVIPDDLRQRVAKGELTQDAAIEVSKARATTASLQAAQSFRQQQEQRRQEMDSGHAIQQAAAAWENDRLAKDPNFATKQPAIMKEVLFLQRTEGMPKTPQEVTDMLKKAYKTVNDGLKPAPVVVPQTRQPQRPVTGGQVAGNQRPTPAGKEMSTLDIIRANRRAG